MIMILKRLSRIFQLMHVTAFYCLRSKNYFCSMQGIVVEKEREIESTKNKRPNGKS